MPPPDIRSKYINFPCIKLICVFFVDIIDKTAIFVAKNGREFEEKIYQKERQNPKFCFLNPHDPYHAYYLSKSQELKDGGQEAIAKLTKDMQTTEASGEVKPAVQVSNEKAYEDVEPEKPADLLFTLPLPNISPLDLDIIKLTAMYVARNGKQFQMKISQKEVGNPQFDFLKPNHSFHRLFLRLIDQFELTIRPSKTSEERVRIAGHDRAEYLKQVMKRAEHAKWIEAQRQKAEMDADRERREYARINWDDFVVVQTIDFTLADRDVELPKPLDLPTLTSMSILQRQELWGGGLSLRDDAVKRSSSMHVEDDAEMEIDEDTSTAHHIPKKPATTGNENIRYDYKPKASQIGAEVADHLVVCSICGQSYPSSQIQEHMRIELLDSKWAEQKKAHQAKHVDTNLVESGTDVSRNLANLAKSRMAAAEISQAEKQAMLSQKVIYDGVASSQPAALREAAIKSKAQIQAEMAELQRQEDLSLNPNGAGPRPAGAQPYYPQQQPYGYPPAGYPPGYYPPPQQAGGAQYPGYPPQAYPGYPYPPQQQGYPGYPPPQYPPGYPQYPPLAYPPGYAYPPNPNAQPPPPPPPSQQ